MSWTQIFSAIHEQRAGGLAWLRYRLDMAGFEGSNPFRPIPIIVLFSGFRKIILCSNMISTIPTIRIILVTDEPVIFPKVRPTYFLHTATIPILYSGREVPRAIIVEPRTDCPIPVESAIIMSESTMNFALIITIIVPMRVILGSSTRIRIT